MQAMPERRIAIAEGSGTGIAGVVSVAPVETAWPGPPAWFSEMIIVAVLPVIDESKRIPEVKVPYK
jgi:hypothetical protein